MNAEKLIELAKLYKENREYITNEETAKMSLVVPFIRLLGFDPNNPKEVRLEYSADFTQGDGKKHADRMDFAIFDESGQKPLMAIETKPLETDLKSKSQQLARYIAQMPALRFGIITDGCVYYFYGDLTNPNVMDNEPFFSFSLDDDKSDWVGISKFLKKFSRDSFNADTLITDAENSRYRQAIIDKLTLVLRSPEGNEEFLKWLTKDIYTGVRTVAVMKRFGKLASESIEPALMRVMGDDFLEKLRDKIRSATEGQDDGVSQVGKESEDTSNEEPETVIPRPKQEAVTTDEEIEFFSLVKTICVSGGQASEEDIIYKDTINYFNVSYKKPQRWFVRYFGDTKRKNICTSVGVDEAKALAPNFEVEPAPNTFGVSRIYITSTTQLWDLKDLILRCLAKELEG